MNMNWFKKSKYDEFDWETVRRELEIKNGQQPSTKEIQKELLRRMTDDIFKEEPVHALI